MLEEFGPMLAGLQDSDDTPLAAKRLMAVETVLLPSVALTVAL